MPFDVNSNCPICHLKFYNEFCPHTMDEVERYIVNDPAMGWAPLLARVADLEEQIRQLNSRLDYLGERLASVEDREGNK